MTVGTAARAIVAWALRGTKQLSPHTTKIGPAKQFAHHKNKTVSQSLWGKKGTGFGNKQELRPWIKKVAVGDKSWLGSMGIGDKGRERFVTGYTKSYKHLRKHKKLYGAGGAGAAIWDFLPGKDNE
jgi:hypothetical protein